VPQFKVYDAGGELAQEGREASSWVLQEVRK